MNLKILITFLLAASLNPFFISCKKKKTTSKPDPVPVTQPPAGNRNVTYEITGTYAAPLFVVYNDNVSGNTTVTVTALPWRKDIAYTSNITGIGIGGNSLHGQYGGPGQSASLKIYVSNTVVQSSSGVADANGAITLPPLAHTFQ